MPDRVENLKKVVKQMNQNLDNIENQICDIQSSCESITTNLNFVNSTLDKVKNICVLYKDR